MSKLQKKPAAHKRGHPTLQYMLLKFFSTCVGHFCPPGSGSTGPIESGSNPDPKPCFKSISYLVPQMRVPSRPRTASLASRGSSISTNSKPANHKEKVISAQVLTNIGELLKNQKTSELRGNRRTIAISTVLMISLYRKICQSNKIRSLVPADFITWKELYKYAY
jgi:hypothetical protein